MSCGVWHWDIASGSFGSCGLQESRTLFKLNPVKFASNSYSQSLQSRLGLELILIFCSRFLVIKLVRSPSWLTVPSSSRAEEIVARRPSD
uniref:Uncharacterized protein n=1 Tax=Lates calcarifer TaxID=8187 RepID=A0A4W6GA86_LATCA